MVTRPGRCGKLLPERSAAGLGSGPTIWRTAAADRGEQAGDGLYWVDVTALGKPPAQVRCDMRTDGGGFADDLAAQDLALWNAWTDGLIGQPEGDDVRYPLNSMQKPSAELEVYFRRNGERMTPILSGVSASVWNP